MKRKSSTKKTTVPLSDVTELLRPYASGWVALSSDEKSVVGAGATLAEAAAQAEERGYAEPLFVKVIPPDTGYIPLQV
jgi:hypothetical protein